MLDFISSTPILFALISAVAGALIAAAIIIPVVRSAIRRNELISRERQDPILASINTVLNMSAASSQSTEERISLLSDRLSTRLDDMSKSNQNQLEQMRRTVDEQLHDTLESRIRKSFELVNHQLENVHKGLGEMSALASSVGELKKVMQGVNTRGLWGEVQLDSILSQMLAPGQYLKNAAMSEGSQERVEFALRLPGQGEGELLIPIDSKFPIAAYMRIVEAGEAGDAVALALAKKELATAVTAQAKLISTKYIRPPRTTDFALMFIPVESLYCEILRTPGIAEEMQQKYRVVISGPTTLSALLNSLQMGFKTLAMQQKSGEVLSLLSTIRTDFGRFEITLDNTRKKLGQAIDELDSASKKTRTITKKLEDLERYE